MALFSVTSGDPLLSQTTPFSTFCIPLCIFIVGGDKDFKFVGQVQVDHSKS